METEALVVDAFAQLGIEARLLVGAPGGGVDLVLDPDGVGSEIQVRQRSLVTDDVAERLLAESAAADATLLVVADRVTDAARKVLTARRGGYLDLRGRLALRTESLLIDVEVPSTAERPERSNALGGKAGLEVATALLMQPNRPWPVRALARELGRSASTVSDVLAALRRDELVDADNGISDTRLFWEVAGRWRSTPTYLAQFPERMGASANALHLWLDAVNDEAGWALTDSAAAVAYGAPVAVRSGQLLDFYVPVQAIVRRATTLLGAAASASSASCVVRVAPVPAVCRQRVDAEGGSDWPLAQPLFVALDLAQDIGRGREILDAWTPDDRWTRVW